VASAPMSLALTLLIVSVSVGADLSIMTSHPHSIALSQI
jgi:hypothetical protein